MKVAVLSGSPEGNYSITLQSVLYLQKKFKEDKFEIIQVGTGIKSLQNDFSPVITAVNQADLVLFAYPVYIFLAPSQLQTAISILKKCQQEGKIDLRGKAMAQISTSKHFYDVTARQYICDNARDLGMIPLRSLCADMDDLLTPKGREELSAFWDFVHFRYLQEFSNETENAGKVLHPSPKSDDDVVVVTDCHDDPELEQMIDEFQHACAAPVRVVNIHDFAFKGGCLGCFHCASDGRCVYNDGFPEFLRNEIQTASALVYAFRIQDHSMGVTFKMYDDRQFCNGHRMVTVGMPVGYLIKGNLAAEPNLRMVIEARASTGQNFLCRIVSDQDDPAAIRKLADEIVFSLDRKMSEPQNFYGVGGMKIFRDLIWTMRGLMKADHRFYKREGVYDTFPQHHRGKMLQMKLLGWMMNNKRIRKKMGSKMNEGKLMPYKKVLDEIR